MGEKWDNRSISIPFYPFFINLKTERYAYSMISIATSDENHSPIDLEGRKQHILINEQAHTNVHDISIKNL